MEDTRKNVSDSALRHTRNAILDSAKKLFLRHGYHKVTMRELAKESGISTGPLYFHFQNKTDVFFAICEEGLNRLNEEILSAASMDLPNAFKLREIFMAFQRFYQQEPLNSRLIRMCFNALSGIDFTETQREWLLAKKSEHMGTMEKVIRDGVEKGELQNIHPTKFMLVLYALGDGIFTAHENGDLERSGITLEELMAEASRLTYTGILSKQGEKRS